MSDQSEKYVGEGQLSGSGTTLSRYDTRYNPWVLTCERWSQLAQYIVLPINPSDIAWHIPLKVATEQTGRATVSYIWRNSYLGVASDGGEASQDSLLQDFELALTFNSGNIAPMFNYARGKGATTTDNSWRPNPGSNADELIAFDEYAAMGNDVLAQRVELPDDSGYVLAYDKTVPLGVQNLYKVLSLLDEPRITHVPGSNRNAIRSNRICLVMNTPAFPNMVVYGHANPSGVSWEESADNPNSFDVTFTITVTETQPKLGMSGLTTMLSSYKAGVGADGVPTNSRDQIYATQQNGKTTIEGKKRANVAVAPSESADYEDTYLTGNLADSQNEIDQAAIDIARERGDKRTDAEILGYTPESSFANAKMSKSQLAKMDVADMMAAREKLNDRISAMPKDVQDTLNSQTNKSMKSVVLGLRGLSTDNKEQLLATISDPTLTQGQKALMVAQTEQAVRAKSNTRVAGGRIPGASRRGAQSS